MYFLRIRYLAAFFYGCSISSDVLYPPRLWHPKVQWARDLDSNFLFFLTSLEVSCPEAAIALDSEPNFWNFNTSLEVPACPQTCRVLVSGACCGPFSPGCSQKV